MIPKVGDIVYLVENLSINIFEIRHVKHDCTLFSPDVYKFDVCVLAGDWPLSYIYVNTHELINNDHIIELSTCAYLILDEETFVNYISTYEIT